MQVTDSKTFCAHPWTSLNINQTGKVFPCMNSDYVLGNIKDNTIQEIINGTPRKKLCETIAKGEWHDACRLCKQNEDSGGFSNRTQSKIGQDCKDELNADLTHHSLLHLTINWSNLCNLTCVYCNPATSTAWQSVKKIPINFVRNEHDSLIELMRKQGHRLQGLTLGGGEPLLQKGMIEMLKHLDASGVRVNVLTNLSMDITKNEIYQFLKTWPHIDWQISFDNATKEKFEYVRHGAEWEQFVANIEVMKQDGQHIKAHPAYSIYSAFDLASYYEFCDYHDLSVFWCDLWHPYDLDTRRLPRDLRLKAVDIIDDVVDKWRHKFGSSIETLLRYRLQMLDPEYQQNLPEHKLNIAKFHIRMENELNKKTHFFDLWPIYKDIK